MPLLIYTRVSYLFLRLDSPPLPAIFPQKLLQSQKKISDKEGRGRTYMKQFIILAVSVMLIMLMGAVMLTEGLVTLPVGSTTDFASTPQPTTADPSIPPESEFLAEEPIPETPPAPTSAPVEYASYTGDGPRARNGSSDGGE
jgi:hypothetical protein